MLFLVNNIVGDTYGTHTRKMLSPKPTNLSQLNTKIFVKNWIKIFGDTWTHTGQPHIIKIYYFFLAWGIGGCVPFLGNTFLSNYIRVILNITYGKGWEFGDTILKMLSRKISNTFQSQPFNQ